MEVQEQLVIPPPPNSLKAGVICCSSMLHVVCADSLVAHTSASAFIV